MIWVDREVKKIKERNLPLEWVDDMKTPSGRIHVGALRGVVIHDLLYKVLLENNVPSKFTYVFEDHDPMDAIPSYLDFQKWEKYAGMQLYKIPSPKAGYKNFGDYYANEFQEVFEKINCQPKIIWGSQLYLSGKMNGVIKEVLDGASKIREIYFSITKAQKPVDWYPFNVVCQKCGKIGTTYVYKWDNQHVYYRCLPRMVAWARGCGHESKVSPYNGNGKIPWKVEWGCKWKIIGVTLEGSGKDHMSKGGSYDIASAICNEVLNYPPPFAVPYEWFIIAGRKMSSSKGVGASAFEVSQILPPNMLRFLIVRTPIKTALDFNPYGETISNLFDNFDICLKSYFDKLEKKTAKGKQGEVARDFARIIELSAVNPLSPKRIFLPRFRTIVNLIKTKIDILRFFENQKGEKLKLKEKEILEERIKYAKIYIDKYAEQKEKTQSKGQKFENINITIKQKNFLKKLAQKLSTKRALREEINKVVFETIKEGNFQAKEVFPSFYQVLIGKSYGPKAADLILELGVKEVCKKLRLAIRAEK